MKLNYRSCFLDEYLCYYEGTSAKLNPFGKCVIPYVDIIGHFLRLWKEHAIPEATNGQRSLATNNIDKVLGHPCGVIRERHIKQVCKVKRNDLDYFLIVNNDVCYS